jgi:hypothetical protein
VVPLKAIDPPVNSEEAVPPNRVAEVRFSAVHEDFSMNCEPNFRFGSGSLANLAPNLGERVQVFSSRSVRVRTRSGKHWELV